LASAVSQRSRPRFANSQNLPHNKAVPTRCLCLLARSLICRFFLFAKHKSSKKEKKRQAPYGGPALRLGAVILTHKTNKPRAAKKPAHPVLLFGWRKKP